MNIILVRWCAPNFRARYIQILGKSYVYVWPIWFHVDQSYTVSICRYINNIWLNNQHPEHHSLLPFKKNKNLPRSATVQYLILVWVVKWFQLRVKVYRTRGREIKIMKGVEPNKHLSATLGATRGWAISQRVQSTNSL